jgi:hypothetical protein
MPFKIVHSLWSKPAFHGQQNYYNSRKTAGWLNLRYFLLSSCLSCLTAKRHHKKIELHTDKKGYQFLIDLLQLPYDDVYLSLNELKSCDHKLWVQAKFKAFELQKEPFIHIDNDVYLWKELFPSPDTTLVTQSNINIWPYYRSTLQYIMDNFEFIPECMRNVKISGHTREANTGVIGGDNIDFYQEYCELAKEFLEKNTASLPKIDVGYFNTVLEQFLFTCLAKQRKLKVSYLFSNSNKYACNDLLKFNLVPIVDKYIHLVGAAKRNKYACEQLELRLCHEFPKEYKKVMAAMKRTYPDINEQDIILPARKKVLLNNISYFYQNDLSDFKNRKIKLADHATLHEEFSGNGNQSDIYLSNAFGDEDMEKRKKLSGQEVILAYFDTPVSISDIMDAIKKEGACKTEQELQEHSNRIVEFVTRKIILDGLLAFA